MLELSDLCSRNAASASPAVVPNVEIAQTQVAGLVVTAAAAQEEASQQQTPARPPDQTTEQTSEGASRRPVEQPGTGGGSGVIVGPVEGVNGAGALEATREVDGGTDGGTDGETDGATDGATDGGTDGRGDGRGDGGSDAATQFRPSSSSFTFAELTGVPVGASVMALYFPKEGSSSSSPPPVVKLTRISERGRLGFTRHSAGVAPITIFDDDNRRSVPENFESYAKQPTSSSMVIPQLCFRISDVPGIPGVLHLGLEGKANLNSYVGYGSDRGALQMDHASSYVFEPFASGKQGLAFVTRSPHMNHAFYRSTGSPAASGKTASGTVDPRAFYIVPGDGIQINGFPEVESGGGITFFLSNGFFSNETKQSLGSSRGTKEGSSLETMSFRLDPTGDLWGLCSLFVLPPGPQSQHATLLQTATSSSIFCLSAKVGGKDADGIPAIFKDIETRDLVQVALIPGQAFVKRSAEDIFRDDAKKLVFAGSATLPPLTQDQDVVVRRSVIDFLRKRRLADDNCFTFSGGGGSGSLVNLAVRIQSRPKAPALAPRPEPSQAEPRRRSGTPEDDAARPSMRRKSAPSTAAHSELSIPLKRAAPDPAAIFASGLQSFVAGFAEVQKSVFKAASEQAQAASSGHSDDAAKIARLEAEKEMTKRFEEERKVHQKELAKERQLHEETLKALNAEQKSQYEQRIHETKVSTEKAYQLIFQSADNTATHMLQAAGQHASIGYPPMPMTASVPARSWHCPSTSVPALTQPAVPLLLAATSTDTGPKNALQEIQGALEDGKALYANGAIDGSDLLVLKTQAIERLQAYFARPFNFRQALEALATWKDDGLISEAEWGSMKAKAIENNRMST